MKKRVSSLLLALVLLVSLLPLGTLSAKAAESNAPTISVESVEAFPGSTVTVNVDIKNNPGILGAKLTLSYGEELTLTAAASPKNNAFGALTFTEPGKLASPCSFVWDGTKLNEEDIKDGTILTLTFQVSDGVQEGQTIPVELSYTEGDIIGRDVQPVTIKIKMENGGVKVINYILGDVNRDKVVNPADLIMLRRHLAGGYDNLNTDTLAADVDKNGVVNVLDLLYIRRHIAGGYTPDPLDPADPSNPNVHKHTMEATAYKAATCTQNGNIAYWHCKTCDKYFSNEEGTAEIALEKTVIQAMGHNYVNGVCSVCGDVSGDVSDDKEYTVSFYCPLAPQTPIKRKITDRTPIADPQNMYQYVFMGWTDKDGNVVTEVEPGTKDITLYANWVSQRNQTISNDYVKKGPIILEDEEEGQILFVYDIGKIINVPLYTIKDFGNTTSGIIVKESESVKKSISSTTVNTITKTVVDATTDSATWTLSKEWNDLVTNTEDFSERELKENNILISDGYSHVDGKTTNKGTVKDTGTIKKNNTTTKDLTTSQWGLSGDVDIGIGKDDKGISKLSPVSVDISIGGHYDQTNEGGTITDKGKDKYNITHTNDLTEEVHQTTSNHVQENQSKIAQEVTKQWHYSIAKSTGETTGESKTSDVSHSNSETVTSSVSYTTLEETTNVKEFSTENAVPGYHRLVCAGTMHVFAVVGYDIANHQYYYYSYNVLDDETHEFWDYSKNNAEYNDYESGVLPFKVPIFVHDYISERVYLSNGLVVNAQTGIIDEYNGNSSYVNIPDYYSRDNGDGTVDLVKITGITPGLFKDKNNIKTVRLSKFITEIPESAFEGCTNLKTVLYNDLTDIGKNAFAGCSSLNKFVVQKSIENLGTGAFSGVDEIEVNAQNASVTLAACDSGAKKLTIKLLMDDLHDTKLVIGAATNNITINGYKKNYRNVEIVSNCEKTNINGINFADNTGIPLTVEGGVLTLTNVNVTNASGYVFVLGQNPQKEYETEYAPVRVILNGINTISTNGDISILSRDVSFNQQTENTTSKLVVPEGKVVICGEKLSDTDRTYLNVQDTEQIEYIDLDQFGRLLQYCELTFNPNGGQLSASESTRRVDYGKEIGALPTPTREGYTFEGWYWNDGKKATETDKVSSDQTLTAKWSGIGYTVKWNAGTGYLISVTRTESPSGAETGELKNGETVYYGDVLSVTYSAAEGYTLGECGSESVTVTGDVTSSVIYASATANQYTYNIVYQSKNGTNLGSSTATYKYGTTNSIPAPDFDGYANPGAQSVAWDSTTAKTITFTYWPNWVATTQNVTNGVWWSNGNGGISYDVKLEYQNRTANSVQVRLVWTQSIRNAYFGYEQVISASSEGASTGVVMVAQNTDFYNNGHVISSKSQTTYTPWMTVPVSATRTTATLSCSWWDGSAAPRNEGSFNFTYRIPPY